MNNRMHHSICLTILLMGLVAFQLANAAPPVRVTSADPPFGNQDSTVTVSIFGRNFDTDMSQIKSVKFLLPTCDPDDESCTPPDPDDLTGGVSATVIDVPSSTEIVATVAIDKSAVVEFRDIEVLMTRGRGGKGTTLFKVEPKGTTNQPCSFDFEVTFDESPSNGLVSDDLQPYDALGGMGFRLDTNDGSQHLERRNDDRFVIIDFSVNNDDGLCDDPTGYNPEGAAGFCTKEKGVDMRLEHWAQDPYFCLVEEGDPQKMVFVVMFEAEPDYLFDNPSKNGKQSGNGSPALWLNYGCISPNLLQGDARPDERATVSNLGNGVWRIEGSRACLHTWLGNKLKDEKGNTMYLNMPFGLTIVDVEALP